MVKENLTLHKAKVKSSHGSCLFVLSDRLPRIFARFQRPTVLPEKKKATFVSLNLEFYYDKLLSHLKRRDNVTRSDC